MLIGAAFSGDATMAEIQATRFDPASCWSGLSQHELMRPRGRCPMNYSCYITRRGGEARRKKGGVYLESWIRDYSGPCYSDALFTRQSFALDQPITSDWGIHKIQEGRCSRCYGISGAVRNRGTCFALFREPVSGVGLVTNERVSQGVMSESIPEIRTSSGLWGSSSGSHSKQESEPKEETKEEQLVLSCATFNILAPIYKRLEHGTRESSHRHLWLRRNREVLKLLLQTKASIICLQELWLANEELVQLYEDGLSAAGYQVFKLPRTNNRGDGLLMAVQADHFEVVDFCNLLFNDCGDRVAQLLRIRTKAPGVVAGPAEKKKGACGGNGISFSCLPVEDHDDSQITRHGGEKLAEGQREFLVVNTHLLFPHDANSNQIRLHQAYKVLENLESYKSLHCLKPLPILICGDLNGTKQGRVFQLLRSQGFVSSYDVAHNHSDSDERWVSHRTHHGVVCGVDFIWLLNPSQQQQQPLTANWRAAVFNLMKEKLEAAGISGERSAFNFFCGFSNSEEDREGRGLEEDEGEEQKEQLVRQAGTAAFTLSDLEQGMDELGLTGEDSVGLTRAEIKELMRTVDTDGNGVIDFEEFHRMVERFTSGETNLDLSHPSVDASNANLEGGSYHEANLEVKDAMLYPQEMSLGSWPEDYFLSDHALLTASFRPAKLAQD